SKIGRVNKNWVDYQWLVFIVSSHLKAYLLLSLQHVSTRNRFAYPVYLLVDNRFVPVQFSTIQADRQIPCFIYLYLSCSGEIEGDLSWISFRSDDEIIF